MSVRFMPRSIRGKLIFAFGLLTGLILALGILSWVELNRSTEHALQFLRVEAGLTRSLSSAKGEMQQLRRLEKEFILAAGDPAAQGSALQRFEDHYQRMVKEVSLLGSLSEQSSLVRMQEVRAIKGMRSLLDAYFKGFRNVADQIQKAPELTPQQANALLAPLDRSTTDLDECILPTRSWSRVLPPLATGRCAPK